MRGIYLVKEKTEKERMIIKMVSDCIYMCICGIQMDRIFGDERTSTSPSLGGFLKLGTHKLSFFEILFIYLFIYGCVGSSFLCEGFL